MQDNTYLREFRRWCPAWCDLQPADIPQGSAAIIHPPESESRIAIWRGAGSAAIVGGWNYRAADDRFGINNTPSEFGSGIANINAAIAAMNKPVAANQYRMIRVVRDDITYEWRQRRWQAGGIGGFANQTFLRPATTAGVAKTAAAANNGRSDDFDLPSGTGSGGVSYVEVARGQSGNEATAGQIAYVGGSGGANDPVFCFNHSLQNGVTISPATFANAAQVWQVEFIPGSVGTQAAGTVTGTAVGIFNGSTFTCWRIGTATLATLGTGGSGGNSPARFGNGIFVLRRQIVSTNDITGASGDSLELLTVTQNPAQQ